MPASKTPHILVIGAGIGGLTCAALLVKAGFRVTVLEAHIYPGGCAGTFYHQGYRFDAGATLAGGFAPDAPHARLAQLLGIDWCIHPVNPAWIVHLPDRRITQWAERERWQDEIHHHFPESAGFWRWQTWLAEQSWQISSTDFPWPPGSLHDLLKIIQSLRPSHLLSSPFAFLKISHLIPADASPALRLFLDSQLLISAQCLSHQANALYGSAALDLPRRGVHHVWGGIGNLAQTLVDWLRHNGAEVHYRQLVQRIEIRPSLTILHTKKGASFTADGVVANLTPWGLQSLLGKNTPAKLQRLIQRRPPTWGAFTLYLGLDSAALPSLPADHFQVIVHPHRPLGEGNSVFISLSHPQDASRAPQGMRAATLSTHTAIAPWWNDDPSAGQQREAVYTELLLTAAEIAIPGIRQAIRLLLPGTPRTFAFYTHRPQGMVGGFPMASLWRALTPATGIPNLWLVGDSIFPGQSTAGVTLGGMRVAAEVVRHFQF